MIDTRHLIDVSGWSKFDITELFDLSLPKGDLQVKKVEDGYIPLITPSNFNNGMLQRISEHSPSTLYNKGSLTVDMFGNAYYQEEDFFVTAHGHVNVLLPKMPLNVYTGAFLASTIRAMFFDKYGFNEMCTQKVLKAESIRLPATSDGQPDWDYMESYMKAVMEESEKNIENLKQVDDTKHLIDVSRWHKCRLGDYFNFETGKDMLPTKEKDGDIPVVCLGSNNNGIGLYIAENPKHKLYNKGCITIAGWAGGLFAFYQEQKFYVKGRVKIAIPKQPLSKLAGLFMCTMIDSESWKYTYAEKASGDKLPNTELYLPVTSTGEPDWQYMEDYMRNIMNKSEQIISDLQIGA